MLWVFTAKLQHFEVGLTIDNSRRESRYYYISLRLIIDCLLIKNEPAIIFYLKTEWETKLNIIQTHKMHISRPTCIGLFERQLAFFSHMHAFKE